MNFIPAHRGNNASIKHKLYVVAVFIALTILGIEMGIGLGAMMYFSTH